MTRRFRPADSVHAKAFDGELVILDLEHGQYFALDEVGGLLWKGLEAGKNFDDVVTEVVGAYDVDRDRAIADLTELQAELVARGLLLVDE